MKTFTKKELLFIKDMCVYTILSVYADNEEQKETRQKAGDLERKIRKLLNT